MKAVLLISHGSRTPKTKQEISVLAGSLRHRLPGIIVEFAFLEISHPGIPQAIDTCASRGAKEIVIALNFLNSGRHVDRDIPAIVRAAQKKYPQIHFVTTKPIGQHPKITDLFVDLINNA